MSEAGDYVPAKHWEGHNFVSARRSYDDHIDVSLKEAVKKGVDPKGLVPETLDTDAEAPLVIAVDVTGSMGEWPATMFSKLPYLEYEGQEYLGDDMQISFCAVGDSSYDKYPLQVQPFVKGADLKGSLEKLIHEKGGGGNAEESYDLAALYYSRNCKMSGAIRKPIFIFVGDEGIYHPGFSPNADSWTHTKTDGRSNVDSAFNQLKQKFNVYCIRKPYGGNEKHIHNQWVEYLGQDRVIMLQDPNRVVDVIFGILANETGRIDYFEDELRERQGKDSDGDAKIDKVLKSLVTVHKIGKERSLKKIAGPKGGGKSKSVAVDGPGPKGGKAKSKSLLD